MKHAVSIVPIANPHEKMEGIQKVRAQEIVLMCEKAKQMPIKQEGDFVKIQNYVMKVEPEDEIKPQIKKKKAQNKLEDAKKPGEQVGGKLDEPEEPVEPEEPNEPEEPIEPEEAVDPETESDVDQEDMRQQLQEAEEEPVVEVKSKKQFKSGMAAMMEDMLNDSYEEPIVEQPIEVPDDNLKEQEYLKIIKQYQLKIKTLNEQMQAKELPIVEEEMNEINESVSSEGTIPRRGHLYPAQSNITIYDEFRLPSLVEDQVKQRTAQLEEEKLLLLEQLQRQQQEMKDLQSKHAGDVENVKQHYMQEIDKLQKQLAQQLSDQFKQLPAHKQSSIGSSISYLLDVGEKLQIELDPQYSNMSSSMHKSMDSNISGLIESDSELMAQLTRNRRKNGRVRQLELINSRINQLISAEEADELMKQDIDSRLTISDLMGMESALRLLKQEVDSNISGLITPREAIQFQQDPAYMEQTLPDSSISSGVENSQLIRMMNSDIEDFNYNEDGSYYQTLEDELALKYNIPKHNRLELYRLAAEQSKKEYKKQVDKLCRHTNSNPRRVSIKSVSSSIGQLSPQSIPSNMSSNVSGQSSLIGSIIPKKERQQLVKQDKQLSQSINLTLSEGSSIGKVLQMNNLASDNSSITSLVNRSEQQQLKQQQYNTNSSVSELQQSMTSSINSNITEILKNKDMLDINSINSDVSGILDSKLNLDSMSSLDPNLEISGISAQSKQSHTSSRASIKNYLNMKQSALRSLQ